MIWLCVGPFKMLFLFTLHKELKEHQCALLSASSVINILQVFLDFRSFDICNFQFTAVYNSIIFSSSLVLLSNFDLRGFYFRIFCMCPDINSVNQGMPVFSLFCQSQLEWEGKRVIFYWSTTLAVATLHGAMLAQLQSLCAHRVVV